MLIKIKKIMCEVFRISDEKIFDNSRMQDIDGWDSMTHMELILRFEKEFEIMISGDDIAEMNSLESIISIINKYTKNK
jgi:acyl carrier protein